MRLAIVLVIALGGSARAEESDKTTEAAKLHYLAGASDFDQQNYVDALNEFRKAYDLSHRATLLFNIALCEEKLGHFGDAAATLKRYLKEQPNAQDKYEVEAKIPDLEKLEAQRKALEPPKPAPMKAFDAPVPKAPPPPPPKPPTWGQLHAGSLTLLSIGAASLISAIGTGVTASSIADDLDKRCPGKICSPHDRPDIDTGRQLALATDVLIGVGAAAAIAGVIVLVIETRHARAKKHARAGLGWTF